MFEQKEKNGIKYFSSNNVGVQHAFTTKGLDVKSRDDRKKFCDILDFNFDSLIMPSQEHTDNIAVIRVPEDLQKDLSATDGVIISMKAIPVMLMFADCTPVMVYSQEKHVVALLHAGWKGTAKGISKKAVQLMQEEFNVNPEELKGLIGAAIGDCCYEVSEDVAIKLEGSLSKKYTDVIIENRANLKKINEYQLCETGMVDIDTMDYCTSCDNHLFYSYRKNLKTPERHGMIAML